jgi:hypothetical protein
MSPPPRRISAGEVRSGRHACLSSSLARPTVSGGRGRGPAAAAHSRCALARLVAVVVRACKKNRSGTVVFTHCKMLNCLLLGFFLSQMQLVAHLTWYIRILILSDPISICENESNPTIVTAKLVDY